jgi:Flp pilus assembly protein TadG
MRRARRENGQALIEAALTVPILLLIAIGIFEFGRAYQTWQILTNAAREGARLAVVPSPDAAAVEARVRLYMQDGQLSKYGTAQVTVNGNATITVNGQPVSASRVTIDYPFDFIMLKPVARLIPGSPGTLGNSLTMQASALMRNEQ